MQWLTVFGVMTLFLLGILGLICLYISIRAYGIGNGSDQSRSVFLLYTGLHGMIGLF